MNNEKYDPNFGDNKLCVCGHQYHRHFDSYENMEPVGCKYCGCLEFKEATMNDEKQVVIEYGRMRFVFEKQGGMRDCRACKLTSNCPNNNIGNICSAVEKITGSTLICTSATKIEDEVKVYHAWNRNKAKHLIGKTVEFHTGIANHEWESDKLESIDNIGSPFHMENKGYGVSIREIKTEKINMEEARERFNIPGNVVIEGV